MAINSCSWDQVENIPNTIIPDEEFLKELLKEATKVADLGPCYGKTMEALRALVPDLEIHGYDFNPSSVETLNDKFQDDKSTFIHETDLLGGDIEKGHDVVTAVGFLSCFNRRSMLKLFRNIDAQLANGSKISIIDFPYLPEKNSDYYSSGREQGLQEGTFTVPRRNNLEVTHPNNKWVAHFLEKNGYTVTTNEIREQEKISLDGKKKMHKVLYLIAEKIGKDISTTTEIS